MWRSLYRWILRRPLALGTGGKAFSYSAAKTPVIWTFVALNAIEVPAFHLLLPWQTARRIVDVLGVYGLIWMLGLVASIRVHPHIVGDRGLRIRNGSTVDIMIPWDAIAAIRTRNRPLPNSRAVQFDRTGSVTTLHLGVLSQTNVDVVLRRPTTVPLPKGSSETITELSFYVDDPGSLVARAREHLTADPPTGH
jgi:hypothetical protein